MTAAIVTLMLIAALISFVKIATMMVQDKQWAMGSVLLLCIAAGALGALQGLLS